LVDAKIDEHIWSNSFERANKNIFALESEIAQQIAAELKIILSPAELQQSENIPTKNIEAYNLYLKGKYFSTNAGVEDINNGIKYFEQAIKNDPEFALAYAGLAYAIINKNLFGITYLDELSEAKLLALKAIELDKNIAEAHIVLGILLSRVEWKWEKAGKEFELAVSLNPNSAIAHFHYATYLHNIKGDFSKARNHINQALLLDPLSYFGLMISAKYYLQEDDFDNAFLETGRAQEIDKYNLFSYWINFENHVKQGKDDKAIDELEKSWNMYSGTQENAKGIRNAYNKSGIKGIYKWIIDLDENSGNPNINTYWLSQKYSFIGETNKALDWLEKTIEINPNEMSGIKYDTYF
jgi:tetratricopeptide (TPR) repeat protein